LGLRGLRLTGKDLLRQALDLYVERQGLSFADAYHAIYVRQRDPAEIYSWDTDFDRIPGVIRVEPP
jgi:predicted nucleic acid-binding protein